MHVMFTSVPAYGHVLPLLPLARAARDDGDAVTVATGSDFADDVSPLALAPVGPPIGELFAESARRIPDRERGTGMHVEGFGDFFGRTRIDLTFADLHAIAAGAPPDLVVAERDDTVGPLVAAQLGVPWVRVRFSPSFPAEVTAAIDASVGECATALGIEPTSPVVEVDCWPDVLQPVGWTPDPGRITMRSEPFRHERENPGASPAAAARRPSVLLTTGTMVDDPDLVSALADELSALDVEVRVTSRRAAATPPLQTGPRVHPVGFAPLASLLVNTDAAVVAGGAGTVAGCLAAGVPLVIAPQVYDQFAIAELATGTGAAITIDSPAALGDALERILADPSFAGAARVVAQRIAEMGSATSAWDDVKGHLT